LEGKKRRGKKRKEKPVKWVSIDPGEKEVKEKKKKSFSSTLTKRSHTTEKEREKDTIKGRGKRRGELRYRQRYKPRSKKRKTGEKRRKKKEVRRKSTTKKKGGRGEKKEWYFTPPRGRASKKSHPQPHLDRGHRKTYQSGSVNKKLKKRVGVEE